MKLLPPIESQDTMLTSLAYPLGFFVSPYLLFSKKKEDSFVRFHAIQGLALNIIVTVIVLVGLLFLFLMAKSSPTVEDIRPKDIIDFEPNPLNNGYMNNGCVFMGIWGLYFLFAFVLFLIEILCASRVWTGEDLRLPFIGDIVEKKFFADIALIEQEADRTGGKVDVPPKKPSVDDLPTTRHDIPFTKTSAPVVSPQQTKIENTFTSVPTVKEEKPAYVQQTPEQAMQDAISYAKQQQATYNQQLQNTRNYADNTSSTDRARNYADGTSSTSRTRNYADGTSSTGRTRNYADGTSSTGRTRTYADGTSSTGRTNTYADGSAKKIQL